MGEIFKIFKHLSRDLLFYFCPGLLIVLNLGYLDFSYNELKVWTFFKLLTGDWAPTFAFVFSFLVGHVNTAIWVIGYEIWIQINGLRKKVKGAQEEVTSNSESSGTNGYVIEKNFEKELNIFVRDRASYEHFIERDNLLARLRRLLATALVVDLIIQIIVWLEQSVPLYATTVIPTEIFLFSVLGFNSWRANDRLQNRIHILDDYFNRNPAAGNSKKLDGDSKSD